MGERETPGPGDISTSEAADKAKNLLEEVPRYTWGEDEGKIIAAKGGDVTKDAEHFAYRDKDYVTKIAEHKSQEEAHTTRSRVLSDAAASLMTPDGSLNEAVIKIDDQASDSRIAASKEYRGRHDAITARDANLWHASQDLQANQAGYRAAAIEDANAAGHDIKYDGIEYPAPEAKQPEE